MADESHANLRAAIIEDLKDIMADEYLLAEELRYNFGVVLQEMTIMRSILRNIILSVAKIDGQLIGNILGHKAVSQPFC